MEKKSLRAQANLYKAQANKLYNNCVFCDIYAKKKYQSTHYGESVFSLIPLNPVTPGHIMFIPIVHAKDASEDFYHGSYAFRAAGLYVRNKNLQANIITSIGPDATQTVFHTHIHVVPRFPDDGLTLPWTGQLEKP